MKHFASTLVFSLAGLLWLNSCGTLSSQVGGAWDGSAPHLRTVSKAPSSENSTSASGLADGSAEDPSRFASHNGAGGESSGEGSGSAPSTPSTPSPPAQDSGGDTKTKKTKRLVIYTARFALLVSNSKDSLTTFLSRVEDLGGHMEKRSRTSLTVRVPAETFEPLLDELRALGKVTREHVDAVDVTSRFRDTTIRLETAEKSRQRLLEILAKAEKTEDILKIEEQIRRLVTEIETLKAELRTLSDRIAYSTISVDFQQNAPEVRQTPRSVGSPFHWINRVGNEHTLSDF